MMVLLTEHPGLLEAVFSSQSCNLEGLTPFFAAFPTTGLTASMKLLRNDVAIFVFWMKNYDLQTKFNENVRKSD